MNRYRGQYIGKDGLKWIVGECKDVKIQYETCTVYINGQYVIWDSLEKFIGINDKGIWVKV